MVVADDTETSWDFADDWRLWHASGALPPPSDDQLREATAVFTTGLAKTILERVGMSARQFAINAGVTPRGVGYWLTGATTPGRTKNWPAAAWGILLLKELVDDQDLELTSHGLKPGAESWKSSPLTDPTTSPSTAQSRCATAAAELADPEQPSAQRCLNRRPPSRSRDRTPSTPRRRSTGNWLRV